MILVRKERVLLVPEAVHHYAHHIEQGDDQRGESQHHVGVPGYLRLRVGTAQVDNQQADDVAQNQAARVAHEQLVAALGVAEHVVEPERDYYPESGESQQGIQLVALYRADDPQYEKGNAAQPGGQTVNAVYQVDGVGDIDHHEQGEQDSQCYRQCMDAEQAAQRVEPLARPHNQKSGHYLHEELVAVAHAHQIVGHADEEKHYAADREEQEFVGGQILYRITVIETQSEDEAQGNQYHREKGDAAQAGHGYLVHFPAVWHVKKAFLVGNQQDFGDNHHSKYQGQQETTYQKKVIHIIEHSLYIIIQLHPSINQQSIIKSSGCQRRTSLGRFRKAHVSRSCHFWYSVAFLSFPTT